MYLEDSAELLDSLAHLGQAQMAQARGSLQDGRIKALAVVSDEQGWGTGMPEIEFYPDRRGLGMPANVVECFLDNAEQHRLQRGRQAVFSAQNTQINPQPILFSKVVNELVIRKIGNVTK